LCQVNCLILLSCLQKVELFFRYVPFKSFLKPEGNSLGDDIVEENGVVNFGDEGKEGGVEGGEHMAS